MAAGGYYADERHAGAFRELLELAASPPGVTSPRPKVWDHLELYPALLLLYAGGVAATAARNSSILQALLRNSVFEDIYGTSPLVLKVYPWAVDSSGENIMNAALHGGQRFYQPIAEWLYKTLREPLAEYLPLDFRYEAAFHEFEALMSLVHADIAKEIHTDRVHRRDWVPLGHFAVVHKMDRGDESAYSRLRAEYEEQGAQWWPIKGGVLKQPDSSTGSMRTIDTVGYNFGIINSMISKMDYF